jgi:excisionase family DNA binding protein
MNQELLKDLKPALGQYLTIKDAGKYVGVPGTRIKQWVNAKVIPGYRMGALLMVKISDLDNIVKPI